MASIETLKQKRTQAKAAFTRAEKSLKKILSSSDSMMELVERRLNDMAARWEAAQDAHDQYIILTEEEDKEKEEEWIDELEARFEEVEKETVLLLRKLRGNQKPKAPEEGKGAIPVDKELEGTEEVKAATPVAKEVETSCMKLEKLKLDRFDGDIRKYPAFKERFNLYIRPMVPKVARGICSEGPPGTRRERRS